MLTLAMVLLAGGAVAQVSEDAIRRIEKVQAERDAKLKVYYQEDIRAAKGNPAGLNAAANKYAPVFEKKIIGTDPALSAEQRMKLRTQNYYGREETVSETAAAVSATTITDWRDDAARGHAVETFRNQKDPTTMKMMFDARRQELKDVPAQP